MIKQLLTIEFRYHSTLPSGWTSGHQSKTVAQVFDTLEEAIEEGNKYLDVLALHFEVRSDDRFSIDGFLGRPKLLVSNTCYSTRGVEYFAKITTLELARVEDLDAVIEGIFKASTIKA